MVEVGPCTEVWDTKPVLLTHCTTYLMIALFIPQTLLDRDCYSHSTNKLREAWRGE